MREPLRVGVPARRPSVARAGAITAVVLGLGITAVACGGGSSSSSSTTSSSTTASGKTANQWATQVCSSLNSYLSSLQTQANNLQAQSNNATSLQEAKTGLVNFINSAVSGTNNLVSQLQAAGPAPTRDGAAISQAIVGGIQQLGVAFSGAQAQAQALPTDDPTAFENQAKAVGTSLSNAGNQIGNNINSAVQRFPADNLRGEFNNNPSCQQLNKLTK
jgi:prophage DNA circulation protein